MPPPKNTQTQTEKLKQGQSRMTQIPVGVSQLSSFQVPSGVQAIHQQQSVGPSQVQDQRGFYQLYQPPGYNATMNERHQHLGHPQQTQPQVRMEEIQFKTQQQSVHFINSQTHVQHRFQNQVHGQPSGQIQHFPTVSMTQLGFSNSNAPVLAQHRLSMNQQEVAAKYQEQQASQHGSQAFNPIYVEQMRSSVSHIDPSGQVMSQGRRVTSQREHPGNHSGEVSSPNKRARKEGSNQGKRSTRASGQMNISKLPFIENYWTSSTPSGFPFVQRSNLPDNRFETVTPGLGIRQQSVPNYEIHNQQQPGLQRYPNDLVSTVATWNRKRVTPAGLKAKLKEEVDKSAQDCGMNSQFASSLTTALKSNAHDGTEEVTTQVHKKFLVAANRYYKGASKYKGVCFNKKKQKWRARISNNGKREFLGDWDTEAQAAMIYDARVKQLHGSSENLKDRLNFPDGIQAVLKKTTGRKQDTVETPVPE